MGSVLFSTIGSPAPGFSKPMALVSRLVSFGEGRVISSTASSWERTVQRHGGGASVVKASGRDQACSNSSRVAQQQSATCWKGNQRPTKRDCHVSPGIQDQDKTIACSGNAACNVRTGVLGNRVVNPVYHASKSTGVIFRDSLLSIGFPLPWLRTVQAGIQVNMWLCLKR